MRTGITSAAALLLACVQVLQGGVAPYRHILVRDFRTVKDGQVICFNIGTAAHCPGTLATLMKRWPDTKFSVWADAPLVPELAALMARRFPNVAIYTGEKEPETDADLLLVSSGSGIAGSVRRSIEGWRSSRADRPVAAYAIGYSVTKDDLAAFPHLKFATGETDTGVIVSWNTEGKENVEGSVKTAVLLPGAISINPLNWKLDETYAPTSENLGSLVDNEKTGVPEIGDIGADAQIVLSRGTVVTSAPPDPMPEELAKITAEYFGPGARHENDYTFYYSNIKANVAKRIAAYKAKQQ